MERILIARLSAMGDIIHSLPAVAALRRAFPRAKIGWIIDERWVDLLAARSALNSGARGPERPLVDVIHTFDVRAWKKNPFSAASRTNARTLIRNLREQKYEIAIDLQAALRSAVLNWLSRAPELVGFQKPRELPARLFYNRSIETPAVHVVDQGLQLANAISGGNQSRAEFPFPADPEAERWWSITIWRDEMKKWGYALIVPGAGWGAKRWPSERYGEVARALRADGIHVFVNSGPGEEGLAQEVVQASNGDAQPISCSLAQLMALLRRVRLCIGGDTGPVHLAAALGAPVVAIYGPTDPARNGPYGPGGSARRIEVLRNVGSETSHARHLQPEAGMLQIGVGDVLLAASNRL